MLTILVDAIPEGKVTRTSCPVTQLGTITTVNDIDQGPSRLTVRLIFGAVSWLNIT